MTSLVPTVTLVDGIPRVLSTDIAAKFGKRHDDVLKTIKRIVAGLGDEFRLRNFAESSYANGQGKAQPCYSLTRDAFSLVVMGFTGKEALAWKVRYIEAFNAMEEELEERKPPAPELPSADAPLTPDQQCTLQAIVRAKVEALPLEQQNKGSYPKVWSRFNNHFRIARYSQLPQSRMSEAVAYLTRMEVLPPAQEQLALSAPTKDKFEAYIEQIEEFRAKTEAEISRLLREGLHLVDVYKFGPDGIIGFTPVLMDWLCKAVVKPGPLVAPWNSMDSAIEQSPLYLIKSMEKMLPEYLRR